MNTVVKGFGLATLAVSMLGLAGLTLSADASEYRTAPTVYECVKRTQYDRNNFEWFRIYPYHDRGHCYSQSREDWSTTTPWAADHKWDTVAPEKQASDIDYGQLPYTTSMVYHHPQTSHKVCLTPSQAERWELKATDAIRPCETWMW